MEKTDLLIIGSGPAGLTAALYAARAGLKPILYQGTQPGGQLTTTTLVENYPGFVKGIQGPELMEVFQAQAEHFGADIRTGLVTAVDFTKSPHKVVVDDDKKLSARAIIISTGASAKWLGLASEKRLSGNGVSSCAICDGFFFKGQDVAVVGGGDSAAEEVLYLAKLCKKVTLLVRKDTLRASDIMQRRIKSLKNVTIMWNTEVQEVLGEQEVTGIKLVNNQTQKASELAIQGLFIAIGHHPNTNIFKDYLKLDNNGYIKTDPGTTKTNVPGVFAAGDVQDPVYRQAITAAGTGCMATLDAERFLG